MKDWIHCLLTLLLPIGAGSEPVNEGSRMEEKIEIESAIGRDRIPQSKEIKRILYTNLCRSTFSFLQTGVKRIRGLDSSIPRFIPPHRRWY